VLQEAELSAEAESENNLCAESVPVGPAPASCEGPFC
jgi:hypothetical protein